MKQYSFLFKPIFFIINLIFATWLVLAIEQVEPSDFGQYKSFFESPARPKKVYPEDKSKLKQLAIQYKEGKIDENTLDKELDAFLEPVK
jgi:hypothetical protein